MFRKVIFLISKQHTFFKPQLLMSKPHYTYTLMCAGLYDFRPDNVETTVQDILISICIKNREHTKDTLTWRNNDNITLKWDLTVHRYVQSQCKGIIKSSIVGRGARSTVDSQSYKNHWEARWHHAKAQNFKQFADGNLKGFCFILFYCCSKFYNMNSSIYIALILLWVITTKKWENTTINLLILHLLNLESILLKNFKHIVSKWVLS